MSQWLLLVSCGKINNQVPESFSVSILVAEHRPNEDVPVIGRPEGVGHLPLQDRPEGLGDQRLRRLRGMQRVHRLEQLPQFPALVQPVADDPLEGVLDEVEVERVELELLRHVLEHAGELAGALRRQPSDRRVRRHPTAAGPDLLEGSMNAIIAIDQSLNIYVVCNIYCVPYLPCS